MTFKSPTIDSSNNVGVLLGAPVAAVTVVLLAAVFITVLLALLMRRTVKRRQRRTLRHRPSKHLLLKTHITKDDAYIDLCSPDVMKTGGLDFSRQKLELQMELGIYL